jgi:hypothetical protein
VVCGTQGRDARLSTAQGDQVPDLGGFRRRVDGYAAATTADSGQVLDPLLRRVSDEDGGRRGPALHLTPRVTYEVRGTPVFPHVQQHGRIRGPPLRPPNFY